MLRVPAKILDNTIKHKKQIYKLARFIGANFFYTNMIFFNKEGKQILSYDIHEGLPLYRVDMNRISTNLLETYTFFILFNDTTTRVVKANFDSSVQNFFLFDLSIDTNGEYEILKSNHFEESGRLVNSDTQYIYEIRIGFCASESVNQYEYLEIYVDNVLSAYLEVYCESEELDEKFRSMAVDNLRFDFSKDDIKALFDVDINEDLPDNIIMNRKYKEFIFEYLNLVAHKTSYKSLINIIKFFGYGNRLALKEYWLSKNAQEGKINYAHAVLDENYNDTRIAFREGFVKSTFLGLFYRLNAITGFDNEGNEQLENTSDFTIEEIVTKLNYLKAYLDKSSFLPEPYEIVDIVGEFLSFHQNIHAFWAYYNYYTKLNTNKNKITFTKLSNIYLSLNDYNTALDNYIINDSSLAIPVINPNNGIEQYYTTYQRKLSAIVVSNFNIESEYRKITVKLQKLDANWETLIQLENKEANEIELLSFAIFKSGTYRLLYVVEDYFSNHDFVEHRIEVAEHKPIIKIKELLTNTGVNISDESVQSFNHLVKTTVAADQLIYDSVNYEYSNKIYNKSLGYSSFRMKTIKSSQIIDKSSYLFGTSLATFRYDLYGNGANGIRTITIKDALSTEKIEFREYDDSIDGIGYIYDALELLCNSNNRIFNKFNYSIEWYEKTEGTLIPVILGISKKFDTVYKYKFNNDFLLVQDVEYLHGSYPVCDILDVEAGTHNLQIIEDSSTVYNNTITFSSLDEFYDIVSAAYDVNKIFKMVDKDNTTTERVRIISPLGAELIIICDGVKGTKRNSRIEKYKAKVREKNYGDDYNRGDLLMVHIDQKFIGDFYDINWELYKGNELMEVQNSLVFRYLILKRGSYSLKLTYKYKGDSYELFHRGIFLALI